MARIQHHTTRPVGWGSRIVAWMGGTRPLRLSEIGMLERSTVTNLFREQCEVFAMHWGELPDSGTARTFWVRARYDAHATWRDMRGASVQTD